MITSQETNIPSQEIMEVLEFTMSLEFQVSII